MGCSLEGAAEGRYPDGAWQLPEGALGRLKYLLVVIFNLVRKNCILSFSAFSDL